MPEFIVIPPGLQALAAITAHNNDVNGDNDSLGSIKISPDNNVLTCIGTDGKITGIYEINCEPNESQRSGIEAIDQAGAPLLAIRFNPELLISILDACQHCAGGCSGTVTMEVRGPNQAVVFRAVSERRTRKFTALLIPMREKTDG